ncbi:MAG: DnaA regulatory inactivator Hda [Idiomarinaceae bacterium]|nr:DnaA regulatory inactivator Hda [Idiomarinaceae bacterium]
MTAGKQQPQQLTLAVQLPDDENFTTYLEQQNDNVVRWLKQIATKPLSETQGERLTLLSGPSGSGKSHLLHSIVSLAGQHTQVMYLPLADLKESNAEQVLAGLDAFNIICLDDIDTVLKDPTWCYELFKLINTITDYEHCRLMMTAHASASQLSVELADLRSRLQWATAFQLSPLNDDGKASALTLRAQWRGLQLPHDVAIFMLHRLGRDMAGLLAHLDQLDKASIAHQRKLTIPFVKQVLAI